MTMEDNKLYTIIVHSENFSGILNQIAAVFTRLQVNIESLNVSASSMKNVHKFTISCKTTAKNIDKILKQINKKLDVINASCYTDEDIFQSEIALFKISTDEFQNWEDTSRLLRGYNTHIVEVTPEYLVVELSGSGDDIDSLYRELDRINCVRQFVRSGKIAVTASSQEKVNDLLGRRQKRYQERRMQFPAEGQSCSLVRYGDFITDNQK